MKTIVFNLSLFMALLRLLSGGIISFAAIHHGSELSLGLLHGDRTE
jgi:hypothetical protein